MPLGRRRRTGFQRELTLSESLFARHRSPDMGLRSRGEMIIGVNYNLISGYDDNPEHGLKAMDTVKVVRLHPDNNEYCKISKDGHIIEHWFHYSNLSKISTFDIEELSKKLIANSSVRFVTSPYENFQNWQMQELRRISYVHGLEIVIFNKIYDEEILMREIAKPLTEPFIKKWFIFSFVTFSTEFLQKNGFEQRLTDGGATKRLSDVVGNLDFNSRLRTRLNIYEYPTIFTYVNTDVFSGIADNTETQRRKAIFRANIVEYAKNYLSTVNSTTVIDTTSLEAIFLKNSETLWRKKEDVVTSARQRYLDTLQALEERQKQLVSAEIECEQAKDTSYIQRIIKEVDSVPQLEKSSKIQSVKVLRVGDEVSIEVVTLPLLIPMPCGYGLPAGAIKIVITLKYDLSLFYNVRLLTSFLLPHSRTDGNMCWGGFETMLRKYQTEYRIKELIEALIMWAESYDPNSVINRLEDAYLQKRIIVDKFDWLQPRKEVSETEEVVEELVFDEEV